MHVYVHVPFCARRCSYCDFAIAVRRVVPDETFIRAVAREWEQWQTHPIWAGSSAIRTVYFGGGTPSRLAPASIRELLDRIRADRMIDTDAEITVEANPDDITSDLARAWHAAGVNRVSLGVQSFDPEVLRWMHRTHTSEQAATAVRILRDAGFGNVSLDLIFGLPATLNRDWAQDLEQALALEPEHLSLYGLTVEPHTPLARWTARGDAPPVDEERYAAEFLAADRALAVGGLERYEVSSAAQPGFEARHNGAYWRRAPYVGLGPSAHSGFGAERRWNVRDWAAYERAVSEGRTVVDGEERLLPGAVALEELYLGLRTRRGVPVERIPAATRSEWCVAGWAQEADGRLRLTSEGWLRLDALVAAVELVSASLVT